jgi:CheY-like chemotaxis protein
VYVWDQSRVAERTGTACTFMYPARRYPPVPRVPAPTPRRVALSPCSQRDPQPAASGDDAQLATSSGKSGPILVVDDDQAILATVADILALSGYPVITAADGREALRLTAEMRPALVLLDLRMPGLDGWEVARTLRARGVAAPILVMTAAQDAHHWAEQIGADGYLAKPFDLDDLLAAVERLWPT